MYGRQTGFEAFVDVSALRREEGFVIRGTEPVGFCGGAVSSAGDVNGDGLGDILIGAESNNENGPSSGQAFVVFGRDSASGGFDPIVPLSLLDGSNGFAINGADAFFGLGQSVFAAGDVNGDGFDDIVIGAPGGTTSAGWVGLCYVVYGRDTAQQGGFDPEIELDALDGVAGFRVLGVDEFDLLGMSVASAGDVNGDGVDDLVIGAHMADPGGLDKAGESYVIFGRRAELCLADTNGDGVVSPADYNGWILAFNSRSPACDQNGDGLCTPADYNAWILN